MSISRTRQRGVTIVEMLVSFVVLSIGMLGIAGLFAVTLRTSGIAIQRVVAVGLASDIADRIRANRRAGEAYALDPVAADDKCVGESSVTCSPEEMAKEDVWLWRQQIAQAFPGGNAAGSIEYHPGASAMAPSTYTIRIKWRERAGNGNERNEPQEYRLDILAAAY
jgi:type IV pilus assembly protein PilV